MKIIDKILNPVKLVDYFGIPIYLEKGEKYLATSEQGCLQAFDSLPFYDHNIQCWNSSGGDIRLIFYVDLEGEDWENTIREFVISKEMR